MDFHGEKLADSMLTLKMIAIKKPTCVGFFIAADILTWLLELLELLELQLLKQRLVLLLQEQ